MISLLVLILVALLFPGVLRGIVYLVMLVALLALLGWLPTVPDDPASVSEQTRPMAPPISLDSPCWSATEPTARLACAVREQTRPR